MSLNCSNNKITTLKDFPKSIRESLYMKNNPISIIDNSIIVGKSIHIENTNFTNNIIYLDKDKLRILFENTIDYNIYHPSGEIYYNRLERMFKDFNI
jgi:Leucine-rich repeat (LRR) protein